MSQRIKYIHNPALDFKVGSVGDPGSRDFFLQITSESTTNTIAIGKTQLEALLERFQELIRELRRQKLATQDDLAKVQVITDSELLYPIEEDFQAGIMGITWEPELNRVSLEIQELSDMPEFADLVQIDEDTSEFDFPPDILQAILEIAQIRGFITLAQKVIAAGRAPCPFCGLPIDISGHLCPRANGYKR